MNAASFLTLSRDEILVSRDESLVSRDETLVSRDESLVSRDTILVSREGGNLLLSGTVYHVKTKQCQIRLFRLFRLFAEVEVHVNIHHFHRH